MPSLTIRHVTTYHYRRPVAFGEHRLMLRPRDSHSQKVIEAKLEISPKPTSLRFSQDAFGNHVGIGRFSERAKDLCFDSTVRIEHESLDAAEFDFEDVLRIFPIQYQTS
jgi:transglutaminase-like putative cysteine protease